MATTLAGVSLYTPRIVSKAENTKNRAWISVHGRSLLPPRARRVMLVRPVASASSTPPGISEKIAESIKEAEEACTEDAASGECAAKWDEVEELSAAASHVREKLKEKSDPLENYCKDNPETDECRTYDN